MIWRQNSLKGLGGDWEDLRTGWEGHKGRLEGHHGSSFLASKAIFPISATYEWQLAMPWSISLITKTFMNLLPSDIFII